MNVDAVLVSFTLEGHYRTYETSGILFNPNLVMLTGTALIPLVQQEKWISLFVNSCSSKLQINTHVQKIYFRVFKYSRRNNQNDESSRSLHSFEGTVVGVWKCPLVSESIKALLSDWTVGHVSLDDKSGDRSSENTDLSKELMSIFMFVKCKDGSELSGEQERNKLEDDIRMIFNLGLHFANARRGQEVEVVSTPFGHKHFMNSLSRGVVSNAVGREKCIILFDARTVSGCEGGPIFVGRKSRKEEQGDKLLGIVTCPLTWWRGEWVGLTIGVSLLPVFKELLHPEEDIALSLRTTPDSLGSDSLPVEFIDETVVLVRSNDSWGSGVILDGASGVVVTCSHVVKDDKVVSVFHLGNQWSADVIFRSRNDVAYDLAVIEIRNGFGFGKEARFSKKPAKLGETVIAAGFPFFSEKDDVYLRPTVVAGCISGVNPYMIQTTCCVQSGFSGGPLFRDGELLGIIISNIISSGTKFPHFNFVAPSMVFKEPILKYIRTKDIRSLQDLESSNSKVQSLWRLNSSKL